MRKKEFEEQSSINEKLRSLAYARSQIVDGLEAIDSYSTSPLLVSRGDGLSPAVVASIWWNGDSAAGSILNSIHETIRSAAVKASEEAIRKIDEQIWELSQQLKPKNQ